MSWTCPKCHRTFKNKNQDHSCEVRKVSDHLDNKPENIRSLFRTIAEFTNAISPDVREVHVKNAILYTEVSNFLAVKIRKSYIQIEFALQREEDVFPVYKVVKYSKTGWAHIIKLDDPNDFNDQIRDWIREAHQVSVSK